MSEPYTIATVSTTGIRNQLTASDNWVVIGISGVADFNVDVIQTKIGGIGSQCNGTNIVSRNIVLTFLLRGDVAESRRKLYKCFTAEKEMLLNIISAYDSKIYRTINFYMEKFECDINENPQTAQVSLICPNPWFEGTSAAPLNLSDGSPRSHYQNSGELETGFKSITIKAVGGSVVNPVITNSTTGQNMKINITLSAGEQLYIRTVRGGRCVKKGNSITGTNIIGSLDSSSAWIMAQPGNNIISQSATSGSQYMTTRLLLTPCYMGV